MGRELDKCSIFALKVFYFLIVHVLFISKLWLMGEKILFDLGELIEGIKWYVGEKIL